MQAGPGRQHCTHLVEQGAAEPKNTLFHTELEIWSVACWGDSHGAGCGTPVPGAWDGPGLGWLRGQGSFPATFQPGAAVAALPSHPGERGQCRGRFTSTPSLPAQPRAGQGARLEAQAGSRGSRIPAPHHCWQQRGTRGRARSSSHFPLPGRASGTHTQDCLGRTPSSSHQQLGEEWECPAWSGLSSTSGLCGDPTGVRVLPVQGLWSGGSPAMAQSSPITLQPLLLR